MLELKNYPKELNLKITSELFNKNFYTNNNFYNNNLNLDEAINIALSLKNKKKLSISYYSKDGFQIVEYLKHSDNMYSVCWEEKYQNIEDIIFLNECFSNIHFIDTVFNKNNMTYNYLKYKFIIDDNKDLSIEYVDKMTLKQEPDVIEKKIIKIYDSFNNEVNYDNLLLFINPGTLQFTQNKQENSIKDIILNTLSYKKDFKIYENEVYNYFYSNKNEIEFIFLSSNSFFDFFKHLIDTGDLKNQNDSLDYIKINKYNPLYTKKEFPKPSEFFVLSKESKTIYNKYKNKDNSHFHLFKKMEESKYIGSSGIQLIDKIISKITNIDSLYFVNQIEVYYKLFELTEKTKIDIKEILNKIIYDYFHDKNNFIGTINNYK